MKPELKANRPWPKDIPNGCLSERAIPCTGDNEYQGNFRVEWAHGMMGRSSMGKNGAK
jgi:hypothetical protein